MKSSDSVRPVAERDDLRRPLRSCKHALRVHVSIRQQPQVAVTALDELDPGHVRQPRGGRTLDPKLDMSSQRGALQRIDVAGGDDASAIDDRDLLADVLHQLELVAGEEDRGAAAASPRRISASVCTASGSRPANGSSRTRSSGSCTSAAAS